MDHLGDSWKVIFSDWTDDRRGNDERTPFCMTAGLLLIMASPLRSMLRVSKRVTSGLPRNPSGARPTYALFVPGNFDFLAIAMHAPWGDSEEAPRDELQRFSNWMKRRFESKYVENHVLIGRTHQGTLSRQRIHPRKVHVSNV
jgi:hypothetical protein